MGSFVRLLQLPPFERYRHSEAANKRHDGPCFFSFLSSKLGSSKGGKGAANRADEYEACFARVVIVMRRFTAKTNQGFIGHWRLICVSIAVSSRRIV